MGHVVRLIPVLCTGSLLALTLFLAPGMAVSGAKAEEVTFDMRVERGRVPPDMRLIRVRQGDVVKLRWSSERPMALHLHGYDITTKVDPGTVVEMSFTARATGRFSVQEHKPKAGGGHNHEAPLVRIEVLPR